MFEKGWERKGRVKRQVLGTKRVSRVDGPILQLHLSLMDADAYFQWLSHYQLRVKYDPNDNIVS